MGIFFVFPTLKNLGVGTGLPFSAWEKVPEGRMGAWLSPSVVSVSYHIDMLNLYGWIILAAVLATHVIDLVAKRLNLRALSPVLPAEFEGVYDGEKYRQSQEYTRVRTRFENVSATFALALQLVFWFGGGFDRLDLLVRSW